MLRRSLVVVWASPWAIAVACGGRTGEDLPTYGDGGIGRPTGAGGYVASGGVFVGAGAATPKPGAGGRKVGPLPAAGGTIGAAGSIANGAVANASFGGRPPIGFGGSVGIAGAPNGCSEPVCMCPDCYSQCTCKLGALGSVALCKQMCFGAGGASGTGGVTGTGGAPTMCAFDGGAILCAQPTLLVPTCCTDTGCGLLIDLAGSPDIPLESGCLPYAAPSPVDARCPDIGMLLNTGASGVPGCCRPDGTCGVALDVLDLGCVRTLMNGKPFRCDRGRIFDAGRD